MIPISLELTNFRAIESAHIDLTEVTIAAVAGRNGAGKSSVFTLAPLFALFGDKIKGLSMDDLVRKGAQEMAVTFMFEHHGKIYRVIRTRSVKGNGKSTLELQEQVGELWVSHSAEKIKDTEEVIRQLINLDAETFTASSMILQGKSNEFTAQTAGKRKDILQQILGLNVYDQLQEQARLKAAALYHEIEKAKDKLTELDERLKDKSSKESLLQQHEEQLKNTSDRISVLENELARTEEEVRQLTNKADRVNDMGVQIVTLLQEVEVLQAERETHSARLSRAEKILANETEILAKSSEFQNVKEQIVALEAQLPELSRLVSEVSSIEIQINKVQTEILPLSSKITTFESLLSNSKVISLKAAEFQSAVIDLEQTEKIVNDWIEFDKKIVVYRERLNNEQVQIDTKERLLNSEIEALLTKSAMLDDSNCIDVTQAACRFLADAVEAKGNIADKQAELESISRDVLRELQLQINVLNDQQQVLGYDPVAHKELRERINQLRPLAEQAGQLEAKRELLDNLLEQQRKLKEQDSELTEKKLQVTNQMVSLQASLEPLNALKVTLGKLQAWANLKDQIVAQHEIKASANERLVAIDTDIALKNDRKRKLEAEQSLIAIEVIDLAFKRDSVTRLSTDINACRDQLGVLQTRIGGIQAEVATLVNDQQQYDRLTSELAPKSLEWARYQTLIRAFGRDGIPALIIENAVPELERIANEILGQMSGGRHYVRFETQRELKSRDGVTETLDIIIGDWTAERPYETFSGGEQLRIDYAIRFALAELLALRAGSKIEWLTIDEGLGSQDAEHRSLVLESIKAVADRFKKVLVITHIEDAHSVFDQRIYFDRTDDGVIVQVA